MLKRRILSITMALTMLTSLVPQNVYAQSVTDTTETTEVATENTETTTTETTENPTEASTESTTEVSTEVTTETTVEATTEETVEQKAKQPEKEIIQTQTSSEFLDVADNGLTISANDYGIYVDGIIAYQLSDENLEATNTLEKLTDKLIAKATYYSYGSLGYSNEYEAIDKAYISYGCKEDLERLEKAKEILADLTNDSNNNNADTNNFVKVIEQFILFSRMVK